jgi:hypothetical protein
MAPSQSRATSRASARSASRTTNINSQPRSTTHHSLLLLLLMSSKLSNRLGPCSANPDRHRHLAGVFADKTYRPSLHHSRTVKSDDSVLHRVACLVTTPPTDLLPTSNLSSHQWPALRQRQTPCRKALRTRVEPTPRQSPCLETLLRNHDRQTCAGVGTRSCLPSVRIARRIGQLQLSSRTPLGHA